MFSLFKWWISFLLAIAILSACSAVSPVSRELPSSSAEEDSGCSSSQEETVEQLLDLTEIYDLYFHPVFLSCISAESWENPEQLQPGVFVHYYLARHYYDPKHPVERNLEEEETVDQLVLEQEVMSHFQVTTEFLRQAQEYDPTRGVYRMDYLGGAASSKVVSATWNGDQLTIAFEYYSPADDTTVIRRGSLQMSFTGEEYQYISCTSTPVVTIP